MSYESDQMEYLRYAIRQEIPKAVRSLKEFQNEFGDGKLINALNENTKEQKIANLLTLCELSMSQPQLRILTPEETKEILITVKDAVITKNNKVKKR
jgi:hypothetical protein